MRALTDDEEMDAASKELAKRRSEYSAARSYLMQAEQRYEKVLDKVRRRYLRNPESK